MSRETAGNKKLNGWRLSRRQTREARRQVKGTGDLIAIECLLRHSIAYGHDRLTIRRFLLAQKLGMKDLEAYEPFFRAAIKRLEAGARYAATREVRSVSLHAQQAHVTTCVNSG